MERHYVPEVGDIVRLNPNLTNVLLPLWRDWMFEEMEVIEVRESSFVSVRRSSVLQEIMVKAQTRLGFATFFLDNDGEPSSIYGLGYAGPLLVKAGLRIDETVASGDICPECGVRMEWIAMCLKCPKCWKTI